VGSAQEPSTQFIDSVPSTGTFGYVVRSVPSMGTRCAADSTCVEVESTCTPGAPDVTVNSLRQVKQGAASSLRWDSSGSGRWNVHRCVTAAALADIHTDGASVVASPLASEYTDADQPSAGQVYFVSVFGADGCTGESVP
jgi:hypothetical protein